MGKTDPSELVQRCNRGDRQAWEELYWQYVGLISASVKRHLAMGRDEVEDVVQEVFVHLVKALKEYDPARSLEAYILEVARHVRISRYRKISALKRGGLVRESRVATTGDGDDEAGFLSLAAPGEDQEGSLIRAQETRLLRRSLALVSDACRRLLGLRYDEGLSYKEIADLLGDKEGTLRVRAQRCMASLSKAYGTLTAKEVGHP